MPPVALPTRPRKPEGTANPSLNFFHEAERWQRRRDVDALRLLPAASRSIRIALDIEELNSGNESSRFDQLDQSAKRLRPHRGRFVALIGDEVIHVADDVGAVITWLRARGVQATAVLRVPVSPDDSGGSQWA